MKQVFVVESPVNKFIQSVVDTSFTDLGVSRDIATYAADRFDSYLFSDGHPVYGGRTRLREMFMRTEGVSSEFSEQELALIRRHIGDYTLYLLGFFPETVNGDSTRYSVYGQHCFERLKTYSGDDVKFVQNVPVFRALSDEGIYDRSVRALNTSIERLRQMNQLDVSKDVVDASPEDFSASLMAALQRWKM